MENLKKKDKILKQWKLCRRFAKKVWKKTKILINRNVWKKNDKILKNGNFLEDLQKMFEKKWKIWINRNFETKIRNNGNFHCRFSLKNLSN